MKSDLFAHMIYEFQSKALALVMEFERDFKNKKGRELSDEEKFYIGFSSGLEIQKIGMPEETDGSFMVKITLEKSDIYWDGTKFLVAKMQKDNLLNV